MPAAGRCFPNAFARVLQHHSSSNLNPLYLQRDWVLCSVQFSSPVVLPLTLLKTPFVQALVLAPRHRHLYYCKTPWPILEVDSSALGQSITSCGGLERLPRIIANLLCGTQPKLGFHSTLMHHALRTSRSC
ncbi:hypothetical protein VTL71DRAFT_12469 [Oculimacula yallundae]|uniref:Uncharacterized protein n=1 Tax=Oculimacula yallundae TaxID=86028 RepID=A0ABR4CN44_9HELO